MQIYYNVVKKQIVLVILPQCVTAFIKAKKGRKCHDFRIRHHGSTADILAQKPFEWRWRFQRGHKTRDGLEPEIIHTAYEPSGRFNSMNQHF